MKLCKSCKYESSGHCNISKRSIDTRKTCKDWVQGYEYAYAPLLLPGLRTGKKSGK